MRRLAAVLLLPGLVAACSKPSEPGPATCSVTGVAVALGASTIDVGAATTATATITQQNCSGLTPTWSAEPAGVATVSSSGTVTGVTAGTATIRAVVNGVAGTATVTVRAVCTVSGVTVTPPQSTIFVSNTVTLTATVAQQNCTGTTVQWESLNTPFATVSSAGVVTGVSPGTATIRATVAGVTPAVSSTAQVIVEAQPLGAVWSTSRLRVAGAADAPTGDFRSVATFGPNAVFVGGTGGVHRFDGAQWTRIRSASTTVSGLWGTAANDLFAVGGDGMVERYNGTTWTPMTSGITGQTLQDVWGAGANAVFAVGTGGVITRYNGTAWQPQASTTTKWLYGVSGSSATNVIAVGDEGVILRYDGTSWTPMASPVTELLADVWVAGPSEAYAAGINGNVLRWNGTSWSVFATLTGFLLEIWGSSPTDIYVVGAHGYAAHFNGVTWTPVDTRVGYSLEGLAGAGATAVAVGNSSVVSLSGSTATRLVYVPDLRGVWAFDRDNAVAVTDVGILWRYVGGAWTFFETGTRDRFYDVWGTSPTNILAIGGTYPFSGGAAVSRFNGATWTTTTIPGSPYMATIWGSGAADVYALGGFEAAQKFNGAMWSPLTLPAFGTIESLWGTGPNDILGVGRNGATVRWNGTTWTVGSLGVSQTARAVWGSAPNNYYAGTESGRIRRFDGANWSEVHTVSTSIEGLAGTGPSDVLAVGYNAEIFRYNGTAWQQVYPGAETEAATAIHAAGGRYFVVGRAGLVKLTP